MLRINNLQPAAPEVDYVVLGAEKDGIGGVCLGLSREEETFTVDCAMTADS